jgi:hypothetical protein
VVLLVPLLDVQPGHLDGAVGGYSYSLLRALFSCILGGSSSADGHLLGDFILGLVELDITVLKEGLELGRALTKLNLNLLACSIFKGLVAGGLQLLLGDTGAGGSIQHGQGIVLVRVGSASAQGLKGG